MSDNGFRFGDWQIDPDSNTLRNGEASAAIEPKAMDVLRYLCRHAGAVIPPEELLQACWGNAELGDNPIHKAITQLRRALGDSASDPRYIETVRKRGYRAIAPVMTGEAALEGSWQQGSPFRGLESFQESHAAIFFGRMQATAQLRELVLRQTSDGCAMALVLGPSGSGKTSLVRAGLLPGLMASRTGSGEPVALACTLYMDCADLADGNLFQALAAVLMDAEVGGKLLFTGENAEGLGRWLEFSDAAAIAGRLTEASGRIKIGLFVDRLEAIFRAPGVTDEIRSRFITLLQHLASSRAVLVMLACRNDFYPEVIALPALMALKSRGGHFDLNPPDGAEIAQMVRMPAKAAGLKFEIDAATGAALDDVLCDAARGSPDTLPLLQYCLDELYRQRSEDGTLRFEVFRQLGGIEGALAVRAEQVVTGLSSPQKNSLPAVLSLIVDVVEEQGIVTARRTPWTTLPDSEAKQLVQALVEARLFVSELAGEIPSFSMAHEALLRRWPRVSEWIELHRHALQLRTRVSQEAEKWSSAGRPRDLLLPPGIRINQAVSLLELEGFSLSSNERAYIETSVRKVKISERVRLAVMVLIGALAILAAILGVAAHQAQKTAEIRRMEAENLMTYMLRNFVDKLRPLGKLELLDDVSSRALTYLTEKNFSDASPIVLAQRAKSLQVIAEVNRFRGQDEQAITALIAAHEILRKLDAGNSKDKVLLKDLGLNSFLLGQIHSDKSDFEKALHYFLEYRNYADRLVKIDPSDIEGWREQAYAYTNIGGIALKQDKLDEAESALELANSIRKKALELLPKNPALSADLANSISFLATTKTRLGNLKAALELYKQEEGLLRPLQENNFNAKWASRLGLSLWHQGDLLNAMGKPGHAQLREAQNLFEKLSLKDPTNFFWKFYNNSVKFKEIESNITSRPNKSSLSDLIALNSELLLLENNHPHRNDIQELRAVIAWTIASLHAEMGEIESAQQEIKNSINLLKSIKTTPSNEKNLQRNFAIALLVDSNIQLTVGDKDKSKELCQNAQSYLSKLANTTKDYKVLSLIVRSYYCMGEWKNASKYASELARMQYNEPSYLKILSTHSSLER